MQKSVAVLLVAALALLSGVPSVAAVNGFIRVSGTNFVDSSCNAFRFSGYNTWQILETASGQCCGGRPSVVSQLDAAVSSNLTVIRMFAYGTAQGYQLQTGATTYNESALEDFDYVVAQAGQRGLKLTIALASNWVYAPLTSGNKCWYTNLTNTAANCDDFYTDANAIQLYKNWVKTITGRVNTVTNVTYGNDPTILSWDLINEPRCDNTDDCSATSIQSWIEAVAPYVKSQISQLLTVGEDGFYQATNCLADKTNPVTNSIGWPLQTGQSFLPNHDVSGIDYAAIHFWPDNWARSDNTFAMIWPESHANLSQIVLKKPLVIEEFGKAYGGNTIATGQGATEADQTAYYKLVYSIVESSFDNGGIIQGIGFWRWGAAQQSTANLGSFDNAATLSTTGSTFQQVVLPFSQRAQALQSTTVSGCTPSSSSAPSTSSTTSTTGRRLLQSSPVPSPANIDASVPQSLCNAYPAQSPSVG